MVDVTYYTDPLCCWSWAFEAVWRRLRYELGEALTWRYRMGGMLERADRFADPMNAISRPAQLGPHWLQVSRLSGAPIDARLWTEDPPASSYPACLAVKAAERQGAEAGEAYLRRVREAAMLECRNVARGEVLLALAEELAEEDGGLDPERFARDLAGPEARSAFADDLREARFREIGRFPSLVMRGPDDRAVIVVGYRPFDLVRDALAHVGPAIASARRAGDPVAYARFWGRVTAPEVAEATSLDLPTVSAALDRAAEEGLLVKARTGLYCSGAGRGRREESRR